MTFPWVPGSASTASQPSFSVRSIPPSSHLSEPCVLSDAHEDLFLQFGSGEAKGPRIPHIEKKSFLNHAPPLCASDP